VFINKTLSLSLSLSLSLLLVNEMINLNV